MRLLIGDTETTGLDHEKDHVVEVAYALFDTTYNAIISVHSELVDAMGNEAEKVNGIPAELLQHGRALHFIERDMKANFVDAVVCHHVDFDRPWFSSSLFADVPWVCSCNDIEWPNAGKSSKSLVALALAHDVPVAFAHRAFDDVLTLARMFQRVAEKGHDVDAMLTKAMRPKARFVANVPRSRNDELKAAGFRWDPDRSQWWKKMVVEEAAMLAFPVQEMP
jgi:DNA polymerase-3 subunit epsilon